jgi:hypothetical protein
MISEVFATVKMLMLVHWVATRVGLYVEDKVLKEPTTT